MGIVYKVFDPDRDQAVAIKILMESKEEDHLRFLREVKVTAKLQHPNIINLHDVGSEKEYSYYTMDFIPGKPLDEVKQNLTTRQTAEVMKKVADAVYYAHSQGVVHRDLKPQNIMMTKSKEPIVMDFGLAKLSDYSQHLSSSGMILGTLHYMPPEQAEGKIHQVDEISDVYALGAILYELLTKRPPFLGKSFTEVFQQIIHREPIPPRSISKKVPHDLQKICLKAIEKKKNDRYSSSLEFALDLERFLQGEPVQVVAPSSITYAKRWIQKNRLVTALIFAFVTLLVSTITFSYMQVLSEVTRAKQAEQEAIKAREKLSISLQESEKLKLRAEDLQRQALEVSIQSDLRFADLLWLQGDRHRAVHNYAKSLSNKEKVNPKWSRLVRRKVAFASSQIANFQKKANFSVREALQIIVHDNVLYLLAQNQVVRWDLVGQVVTKRFFFFKKKATTMTFIPKSEQLAIGTEGGEVLVWDTRTRQLVSSYKIHDNRIVSLAVHPQSRFIVSACRGGDIHIRDLKKQTIVQSHKQKLRIYDVRFSPQGDIITVSGASLFKILNFSPKKPSSKLIFKQMRAIVLAAAFDPSGAYIALAASTDVFIWHRSSNRIYRILKGHVYDITGLNFINSRYLVSSSDDYTLRIWDIEKGKCLEVLRNHQEPVHSIAYSPTRQEIFSMDSLGNIGVWKQPNFSKIYSFVATGQEERKGHLARVLCVRGHPTQNWFGSAGADSRIIFWNLKTQESFSYFRTSLAPNALDFIGGDLVAVGGNKGLAIINFRTGSEQSFFPMKKISKMHINQARTHLLLESRFNHVYLWKLPNNKVWEQKLPRNPSSCFISPQEFILANDNKITRFSYLPQVKQLQTYTTKIPAIHLCKSLPGTRLIALTNRSSDVYIYDLKKGEIVTVLEHTHQIYSLAFHQQEDILVTGSIDSNLYLWDTKTWQLITALQGHELKIFSLGFLDSSNQILSGSGDTGVGVWDLIDKDKMQDWTAEQILEDIQRQVQLGH